MMQNIFKLVCLIIMLSIVYNVVYILSNIFELKVETFTVGYQSNEEEEGGEGEEEGKEKEVRMRRKRRRRVATALG